MPRLSSKNQEIWLGMTPGEEPVDLSSCDKEPIHIPGSIQPHGVLLVLSEPDFVIRQCSVNADALLATSAESLLGKPVTDLFGQGDYPEALTHAAHHGDGKSTLPQNPELLFVHSSGNGRIWNVIHHHYDGRLILELEPHQSESPGQQQNQLNYFKQMTQAILRLKHCDGYKTFLSQAALELKAVSGFDRVMVYKFDPHGHGHVIAEAREPHLESYEGTHYPASDIPKQARELYLKNHLRFITDVNYQPVGLMVQAEDAQTPLDMSRSVLRSVSPIHIEYLQNMGVSATMVISLIENNELWGLIACHHYSTYYVNYDIRTTCENLSHFVMLELIAREKQQQEEYDIRLKGMLARFIEFMHQQNSLVNGLIAFQPNLGDFIDSEGVYICASGDDASKGNVPDTAIIGKIVDWLAEHCPTMEVFSTDCLADHVDWAEGCRDISAGFLAAQLSSDWKDYIIWFRPEVIQTVDWAGDPTTSMKTQKNGERLTPRGSFALWKETVQLNSLPWTKGELEAAHELRASILRIVLQKTLGMEEREKQFRTLANSVPQLAWIGDPSGALYWYNQRWYDFTGTTLEEVKNFGWKRVHHPDYLEPATEKYLDCIRRGEPWEDYFPLRGKDGEYRWFLSRALPVRNSEGQIVSWFGTNTDVTEQRQVEAALRESEARFRVLADTMPQIVWSSLPDGTHDYFNQRWFDVTGATVEESEGTAWLDRFHPDDKARCMISWERSIKTGVPYEVEYRLKVADGTYHWFLGRARPMRGDDGNILRWFGTGTDISDIVSARDMLAEHSELLTRKVAERTAELENVNHELESFSYSVSHDLRAPLRGLNGFSSALMEDYGGQLDDTGRDYLNCIHNEANRMGMLIDGLLNLSRMARQDFTKRQVNLSDMSEKIIRSLREAEPERSITIEIQPDLCADVDEPLIASVLQNLLENAWKFTAKKPEAHVRFGLSAEQSQQLNIPVYTVSDNGTGFDMRYASKLFGPFQRLHTIREFPGTGIGLATVQRIISRHGGKIWANAKPGEGATFYFTLSPVVQGLKSV